MEEIGIELQLEVGLALLQLPKAILVPTSLCLDRILLSKLKLLKNRLC